MSLLQEYSRSITLRSRNWLNDQIFRRKGYGRKAIELALDFIRTFPAGEAKYCWLSYEPKNEVARNLYASFGFVEHPEQYEEVEEMPAILTL
ncbi:MAG: GNAT family N-acetyltransferase [Spirochaetales bacterium]|nr:GNAT family N-acetyltransferase [Spirochaetales bacterium]